MQRGGRHTRVRSVDLTGILPHCCNATASAPLASASASAAAALYSLRRPRNGRGRTAMGHGVAGLLGAAACAAAILLGAGARAWADGALAVGSTGDVVGDGIAFGMVVDVPKEKAADEAVRRCRTFKAQTAADRCKLVATFSGECFAVAYDPQPGTPGAGWGIGRDQATANRNAIAMCEETAGPSRKGFCRVESAGCDGQAGTAAPMHGADGVPPAKPAARRPDVDPWADVRKTL